MLNADWVNFAQLISTIVAILALVLTLLLGGKQLNVAVAQTEAQTRAIEAQTRATEAQLILMVDDSLQNYEDVRALLNNSDPNSPSIRLRRYIGRFERLGILCANKQISLELINQLYGSRFEKLLHDKQVEQLVAAGGWEGFCTLWSSFYKAGFDGRRIPSPPAPARARVGPVAQAEEDD